MTRRFPLITRPLLAAAIGAACLPGPVLAHSHEAPGEHVEAFREHIADYETDVEKLVNRLNALAERSAAGEDVAGDLAALVEAWEAVDYHEVIERKAVPMYGPIWQHIYALKEAVNAGEPAEVIRERADQTAIALHEGMGALKLRANMKPMKEKAARGKAHGDAGPEAAIHAINEALEHAVGEYAEGEPHDAKELIADAYFERFEGIEGSLIERDAELVSELEEGFNAVLPALIDKDAPLKKVREQVDAMKEKLARGAELLAEAEGEKSEVF